MERAAGIEPASSAWKAEVIAIIRCTQCNSTELFYLEYGGGGRIRTIEAFAADLQSAPFGHSGTPPHLTVLLFYDYINKIRWCRLPESNW